MNFTPNLVIGIGIIGIGVALTLDKLGLANATDILRLWPVLLVLFGISVVVQAFRPQGDPAMPRLRPQPIVTAPLVFAIVIIGLLMSQASGRRTVAARGNSDQSISMFAVLGGDNRTSFAKPFRGAEMTSFMGGSRLDLREATIPPGEEAVIDVLAMMGGVTITVPSGWTVDVEAVSVMGGVKDERFGLPRRDRRRDRIFAEADAPGVTPAPAPTPEVPTPEAPAAEAAPGTTGPAPRLVVRGFIMMGGLVIRS